MRALSIMQPWAELIVAGIKDVENRTWPTGFRGPIIIHTGQRPDARWSRVEWERMFYGVGNGLDDGREAIRHLRAMLNDGQRLTYGAFIVSAEITECFTANTTSGFPWHQDGFYGFHLENVQRFVKPVRFPGQLKIFEVAEYIAPRITDELVKIARRMNGADPT